MIMLTLSKKYLDVLEMLLPDHAISPKRARPSIDKRCAFAGIFWVFDSVARWKDLLKRSGSTSSAHRRFLRWVKAGVFDYPMRSMVSLVEEQSRFRFYECFLGQTFAKDEAGREGIGFTKAGHGLKIMILVDAKGLPLAFSTALHEKGPIQELFGFMLSSELPERVIGDKAYNRDALDEKLALQGIALITPNHVNRHVSQDGCALHR
jgi:hypothetical protein